MIPAQIPAHRDRWPLGVLDALQAFRQGDVIEGLPYFYWGDPTRPVLDLTASYTDEGEGVIEAARRFDYGMIATQTCDLAEEDTAQPGQPWVHLCPVYNAQSPYQPESAAQDTRHGGGEKLIPGSERNLIRQGRSQRYLWLPALADGFWVADLRLFIPVEKGWLAGRQRIEGFAKEADRVLVGRRLAWLHDRPAFDGRFVRCVQKPLRDGLWKLRSSNRPLFDQISHQVVEIGVSTDRNIEIATAEIVVLCEAPLEDTIVEWFNTWWISSAELAGEEGVTLLPLRIEQFEVMRASEYRQLTRLPLAAVSPNPAWYGPEPYDLTD